MKFTISEEIRALNTSTLRLIIISRLPELLLSEIKKQSEYLSSFFHNNDALLYPPHITIRTGALVPLEFLSEYIEKFESTVNKFLSITIKKEPINLTVPKLIKYRENDNDKLLIAYTVQRSEWLVMLNSTMNELNDFKKSQHKQFNPHISLAYDDIDRIDINKVTDYLSRNIATYTINKSYFLDNIGIYFQGSNAHWECLHSVNLPC